MCHMIKLKILFKSAWKLFLISILWQIFELAFYGEVQPRIVDDIIAFILFHYIYKSEEQRNGGMKLGTIRNRLTIVHDYNLERITKVRENAVMYFSAVVTDHESRIDYDVNTKMISPILHSFINGEYTFVIMGDCSKLGWSISEDFEQYRNQWIKQNMDKCQNILVADFGEGDQKAFITEYTGGEEDC